MATIPKDITGLGLTINYKLVIQFLFQSGFPATGEFVTNFSVLGTNTEMFLTHLVTSQWLGSVIHQRKVERLAVLPGAGYVAI